jgi:hypothetical protein
MLFKKLFTVVLLGSCVSVSAQSYLGLLSDGYSGVHTVIANPAGLSGMPFRTDINLVGASAFVGNDFYSVQLGEALSSDYDFSAQAQKSPSSSNHLFGNVDVLGPAFSIRFGEKTSMAFFSRARAWVNLRDINGETFDNVSSDFDSDSDFSIEEGDFNAQGNAWSEIGISLGTVLMEREHFLLRVGASAKYLQGYANSYVMGENVAIDYRSVGNVGPNAANGGRIESSGQIAYGYSTDFQDYVFGKAGSGIGLDVGLVLEWRKAQEMPYRLRVGASLMDIGSISYDNGNEKFYDITNSISQEDLENTDGLLELFDSYYTELDRNTMERSQLPTALRISTDYHVAKKWYLHADALMGMVSSTAINASRVIDRYTLTPRYQTKWFSMYTPLGYSQHLGLQWGAGFRLGPIYFGSASLLSTVMGDDTGGADIYAGVKVPIY